MKIDDKVKVVGRSNLARHGKTGVVTMLGGGYTEVQFGASKAWILTAELEVVDA